MTTKITTIEELEAKCAELKKHQEELDELYAIVESLKDEIKSYMGETELLETNKYTLRYTKMSTNRFNSNQFSIDHPKLYKMYMTKCESRRFSVNG